MTCLLPHTCRFQEVKVLLKYLLAAFQILLLTRDSHELSGLSSLQNEIPLDTTRLYPHH